ncbi:unnamed protein product [Rotaria sordida]|uniref:NAD(P)(+)--arginine ADP-ribosyltransferase n=1 Tax=Rotaria sordida TaxID=392033 RepID=A0A819ZFS7_9BILA|nr:unnamed protein product [Rotaria sordida]
MPDPVLLSQSFTDARHRASFLDTAGQFFNLSVATPSNGIPQDTLVERAAEDIVIEAREVRKEKEGKWMAEQLLKKMNEIMRIGIDETYQALWQNKLSTFGPVAILLFTSQRTLALPAAAKNRTVYCGADLSSEQIEQYRRITSLPEANRKCGQLCAFTSTSRNKEKAQEFGNVLFVIEIAEADGCDVSLYSEFDEEEHLLEPHFYFSIKSYLFDNTINK